MDKSLDACAMLAYLQQEAGEDVLADMLKDATVTCFAHAVNMVEVYYHYLRVYDEAAANKAVATLESDGVIVREDLDEDFWKAVAGLKRRGRISLADCFCIALAQRLGGEVVTTDHHEFDALVPLNLVPINFIR